MSKNYKYSQAEENYIRDKLDELAKNGRLLASTDDVFDYLEEIGVAFSGYFDSLPRTEQRRIVEEHKQKHREYEAGPAVAASGARGALSADSAYGSSSRMSGPTGIDRLRQADEDSVRSGEERAWALQLRHVRQECLVSWADHHSASGLCQRYLRNLRGHFEQRRGEGNTAESKI